MKLVKLNDSDIFKLSIYKIFTKIHPIFGEVWENIIVYISVTMVTAPFTPSIVISHTHRISPNAKGNSSSVKT